MASDTGNTGNTGILRELSCYLKNTGKHTLFHPNTGKYTGKQYNHFSTFKCGIYFDKISKKSVPDILVILMDEM